MAVLHLSRETSAETYEAAGLALNVTIKQRQVCVDAVVTLVGMNCTVIEQVPRKKCNNRNTMNKPLSMQLFK